MIREWREDIHIECSDREAPRIVAALTGHYEGDTHVYLPAPQPTVEFEFHHQEQRRLAYYGEN